MALTLLSDNIHFTQRNFAPLIDYLTQNKIIKVDTSYKQMKVAYGNYVTHRHVLQGNSDLLSKCININNYQTYNYDGINLFSIAELEIKSILIPLHYKKCLADKVFIDFEIDFELHRQVIIDNYAAAIFWLNYWKVVFSENEISHAITFSGSSIYQKSFKTIAYNFSAKFFLVEHLWTGNEFLLEEQPGPIPNGSIFKYQQSGQVNSPERLRALDILNQKTNKNVKSVGSDIFLKPVCQRVLIIGQVCNDYSILRSNNLNDSIANYVKVIDNILNTTSYDVVFKAHPYESNKTNIGTALTKEILEFRFEKYITNGRLLICENVSLKSLYSQVSAVMTMCSQAGLEASLAGFKVFILGKSFYSNNLFNKSFDCSEKLVKALNNEETHLNELEFSHLFDFCTDFLVNHAISSNEMNKVSRILDPQNEIGTVSLSENEVRLEYEKTTSEESESAFKRRFKRKLRKFLKDPKSFFIDANRNLLKKL